MCKFSQMKTDKFSLIIFYLLQLYTVTILCYTSYGVYKSYSEYFCTNLRPDNPDFQEKVSGIKSLNLSALPGFGNILIIHYDNLFHTYIKTGDSLFVNHLETDSFSKVYQNKEQYLIIKEITSSENLELNYKVGTSFFEVKCAFKIDHDKINRFDYINDENFIKNFTIKDYMKIRTPQTNIINSLGYFSRVYDDVYVVNTTATLISNETYLNEFECTMVKSPQTCDISQYKIDSFFKFYFSLMLILVTFFVLTTLPFRRYMFKRFYMLIIKSFKKSSNGPKFCNPVTGYQVHIKKGEFITTQQNFRCDYHADTKMSFFKDMIGEYFFNDDSFLIINCEKYKGAHFCDTETKSLIERYFYNCYMDSNLCAVDQNKTHYLETHIVLLRILDGMGFELKKAEEDIVILDIKEFEFNLIKSMFELKECMVKVFIEHNWLFFGQKYNMTALTQCLKNKTMFCDRPKSVGNAQWKIYVSDFRRLVMDLKSVDMKHLKLYGKTKAYEKVSSTPTEKMDILKLKDLTFSINTSRCTNYLKDNLINTGNSVIKIASGNKISEQVKKTFDAITEEKVEASKIAENAKSYKEVLCTAKKCDIESLKKATMMLSTSKDLYYPEVVMDLSDKKILEYHERELQYFKSKPDNKGDEVRQKRIKRHLDSINKIKEKEKEKEEKYKNTAPSFDIKDAIPMKSLSIHLKKIMIRIVHYDDLLKKLEEYDQTQEVVGMVTEFKTEEDFANVIIKPRKYLDEILHSNKSLRKKFKTKKKGGVNMKSKNPSGYKYYKFKSTAYTKPKSGFISDDFSRCIENSVKMLKLKYKGKNDGEENVSGESKDKDGNKTKNQDGKDESSNERKYQVDNWDDGCRTRTCYLTMRKISGIIKKHVLQVRMKRFIEGVSWFVGFVEREEIRMRNLDPKDFMSALCIEYVYDPENLDRFFKSIKKY